MAVLAAAWRVFCGRDHGAVWVLSPWTMASMTAREVITLLVLAYIAAGLLGAVLDRDVVYFTPPVENRMPQWSWQ